MYAIKHVFNSYFYNVLLYHFYYEISPYLYNTYVKHELTDLEEYTSVFVTAASLTGECLEALFREPYPGVVPPEVFADLEEIVFWRSARRASETIDNVQEENQIHKTFNYELKYVKISKQWKLYDGK